MHNDILLDVKDVRVYYGKVEALKGVSMKLEEGRVIALVGNNGAGKTTVLRTISGLKRATSGEIWFGGQRIDRASPQEIVGLGVAHVPEGRRVFPYMTVYENLKMGAYTRKGTQLKKDLDRVYDYFPRLKERTRQQAGKLSGGEQQMLAIGRALMTGARLIMMDEPSMGLSPVMVSTIGKVIGDINQEEGVSIVLVEQNTRVALKVSQRAYILEKGRITLEGDSNDLINDERVKQAYLGA
jgi:branched-chain amino acid transport system ATP-binding protein